MPELEEMTVADSAGLGNRGPSFDPTDRFADDHGSHDTDQRARFSGSTVAESGHTTSSPSETASSTTHEPVPIATAWSVLRDAHKKAERARRASIAPQPLSSPSPAPVAPCPMSPTMRDQALGLRAIRRFLKNRTNYEVLPVSYRLIQLDQRTLVKTSLTILIQNGIVSAPLWDSATSTFCGLLTTADYINVIQYYWQHRSELKNIGKFRLDSLRDVEKAIGVAPIETISIHPRRSIYDACRCILESRARRVPLIDVDDETKNEFVVSVVTQYRILKFISFNVTETQLLKVPLKKLGLGCYHNLVTTRWNEPVINAIHLLVKHNISSIPIVNSDNVVINVFEAVDVITLIKDGSYEEGLNLTVGEALNLRPLDYPGIYTCHEDDRLDSIFDTIRRSRVHRFTIVTEDNVLVGVLALSDILKYILLEGEGEDDVHDPYDSYANHTRAK
ncbi:AMP-activated serine/threonine-protein kinase regulatory subunit [Agyrium rufum]|nr:AMP-activated serine/threonine-protein kinase regulatory subunit [Agyrium rufum]